MYNLSQKAKILSLILVIFMKDIVAKESDLYPDADIPKTIRTITHPSCLPLYKPKFECFKESRIITSNFLTTRYSQLIRKTILGILALLEYDSDNQFVVNFHKHKDSINKCIAISKKWDHSSRSLFSGLETYMGMSAKTQDGLKIIVTYIVRTFITSLEQSTDIDGLELQLLCMPVYKDINLVRVQRIAQSLQRLKREEIAVHYLLSFANQVPNMGTALNLCDEARKLDSKQASDVKANLDQGGLIIWQKRIMGSLDAVEAALRLMPIENYDQDFIFTLVDYLDANSRTQAAIHYLLNLAERLLYNKQHIKPRNLHREVAAYYAKAETLGSIEAAIKRQILEGNSRIAIALVNPVRYIDRRVPLPDSSHSTSTEVERMFSESMSLDDASSSPN
jgi:hypothetical protein